MRLLDSLHRPLLVHPVAVSMALPIHLLGHPSTKNQHPTIGQLIKTIFPLCLATVNLASVEALVALPLASDGLLHLLALRSQFRFPLSNNRLIPTVILTQTLAQSAVHRKTRADAPKLFEGLLSYQTIQMFTRSQDQLVSLPEVDLDPCLARLGGLLREKRRETDPILPAEN